MGLLIYLPKATNSVSVVCVGLFADAHMLGFTLAGESISGALVGSSAAIVNGICFQLGRAGVVGQIVELTVHRQHRVGPLQHPKVDPDGTVFPSDSPLGGSSWWSRPPAACAGPTCPWNAQWSAPCRPSATPIRSYCMPAQFVRSAGAHRPQPVGNVIQVRVSSSGEVLLNMLPMTTALPAEARRLCEERRASHQ
ncbi:hypothetical protein [Streptomyces sp. NPDC005141]